jgi:hypothetical protein
MFNMDPWMRPAPAEPSRKKAITIPEAIARRKLAEAVEETLRTKLPEGTTVDGSIYSSGGRIIINHHELPANPDGQSVMDITPVKKGT